MFFLSDPCFTASEYASWRSCPRKARLSDACLVTSDKAEIFV
jgi:hypothetical protein